MRPFALSFTGDFLDSEGKTVGDLALDLLEPHPHIRHAFLRDQSPSPNDPGYTARLYHLEVTADHVAASNGIVVCRPWVRAFAFARGAGNLVAIGRAGIGYDKIDLAACTANDVVVFNSPDGLTHSTASAALLFMLALAKRLPVHERITRTGRWDLQKEAIGEELTGGTLGIVGLGRTARELVRLVAPFGMRVIAYSPHADPAQARDLGVRLVPSLAEVLREADFLSLHCRLDERTRGMIGARELDLMKPTAYLVNVGRGELVDQAALARALAGRRIAGAGLDVFETEPLPLDDPLLALDNVILTPHWLSTTRQSSRLTMGSVVRGILDVARGDAPENVINPEVLTRPGFEAKLDRYKENRHGEAENR